MGEEKGRIGYNVLLLVGILDQTVKLNECFFMDFLKLFNRGIELDIDWNCLADQVMRRKGGAEDGEVMLKGAICQAHHLRCAIR